MDKCRKKQYGIFWELYHSGGQLDQQFGSQNHEHQAKLWAQGSYNSTKITH